MNEYRVASSGAVVNESELRAMFRRESFGVTIDAATLNRLGVAPVLPSPPPVPGDFQDVLRSGAVLDGLGNWVQKWTVTDWTEDRIVVFKENAKLKKAAEIKAERDRRRFEGGVKVGSLWFLSTQVAAGEYTALMLLSTGLPGATVLRQAWRTMNGDTVDMTPLLVKQILQAGFASAAAIDDAAQIHLAAMKDSVNPATYDFSQGWPEIYVAGG